MSQHWKPPSKLMSIPSSRPDYRRAFLMARQGYGIEDLVVVCRLRRDYAKRIIWSVENERHRQRLNNDQRVRSQRKG